MGACALKLEPMKVRDIDEVVAILQPITGDSKIRRRIKQHIRDGLCRIMRDSDNVVCALAMAISDGINVSLSYYWVREDKRKSLASLWLFMGVFPYFKDRNVYIHSEDVSTFKEYVEPTKKKNEYRFIGVGNNIDPEKLSTLMKAQPWEG
jgi:hypothetical protein